MAEKIKYVLNGEPVTREEFLEDCPEFTPGEPPAAQNPALWPMASVAAGVLPEQVPEAMEHGKRHGYVAEFDKQGRMIFHSQHHQREVCRKLGIGTNFGNRADYFA